MNDREKLIDILESAESAVYWNSDDCGFIEKIADHLIANGVTVQQWIPVDYYEEDGRRKLTVSQFSMCADCLVEMREYLRGKYVMYEQEYSGVVVRKKGEQE